MKEQKLSIAQSVIVEEGDPWYGDRIIFQVPCFQFSETVERSSGALTLTMRPSEEVPNGMMSTMPMEKISPISILVFGTETFI